MSKIAPKFLAIDLGASSGRVFACSVNSDQLEIESIHRFENNPVKIAGTMYWNLPSLWENILLGLRLAAKKFPSDSIVSVGVDCWGVDYGLVGPNNELLSLPVHYRDSRTEGILDKAYKTLPADQIYQETGLQILSINSLFQLVAQKSQMPTTLNSAKSFLMMPDLFHWLLSGKISNEITDLSTSQLIDPRNHNWNTNVIHAFDLPSEIFGEIVRPGTTLGPLREDVIEETGLSNTVNVVVPATHDTASAVAAVPNPNTQLSANPDWCYISSGTWSLMGVEIDQPIINDLTKTSNFTNEIGVEGSIRLLKNIAGLWLIQQCKAHWEKEGTQYSWQQMVDLALSAEPYRFLFDPDNATLAAPANMPNAIADLINQSSETSINNSDHAAIIRSCFDSLGLRYRYVLNTLEKIIGNRIEKVYVVGGGSQNQLLCQITADLCQRKVFAGPAEATVIGNALIQAMAAGAISEVNDGRRLVSKLMPPETYQPKTESDSVIAKWDAETDRLFR